MTKRTTRASARSKAAAPPLRPSLGKYVCRWIERTLVHGEGDFFGQPFLLEPWQKQILYWIYEYDPVTLRRVVRRVLIVLPKGCGKTELTAAITLVELAGPVVIQRVGDRLVPARRLSPNIPVAAASFEQADRLFGAAATMAKYGPLGQFVEVYDTEILLVGEPGKLFRIAAEAGTNDGGLPTCFAADEIHEWVGRKARLHLVVGNSLAKRANGLELNISTPDDADPQSLLGTMVDYGRRVNSGEVVDPSFLFVHYTAPTDVDLNDPVALREAIRMAHPASWIDVDQVAARWEIDRIPAHEFGRYHLAQFIRGTDHWIDPAEWAELVKGSPGEAGWPPKGTSVVLGFDGSYNNDSTALVGCTIPKKGEKPHVFVVAVWEREDPKSEWVVPRHEVDVAIHKAMALWRVKELACDPPGWHEEIERWATRYGDDVVTTKYQTNRRAMFSDACSKFFTGVRQELFTQDGDQRLARHLANAVVKETIDGAYITKDGRNSPHKIDLAVAALIAYDRATQAKPGSVYDRRGLVMLGVDEPDSAGIDSLIDDDEDLDEAAIIRARRPRRPIGGEA